MPIALEFRLAEPAELLFRQASPPLIQDGVPTSLLFRPMPKDHGLLSVDREAVIGLAEKSRERFRARGFQSHSTWAVSVGEVRAQALQAYADPTKHNDAHALIDMSALSDRQMRDISKRLREAAVARGRLAPQAAPLLARDSATKDVPKPSRAALSVRRSRSS
jgi:hypothetical protein